MNPIDPDATSELVADAVTYLTPPAAHRVARTIQQLQRLRASHAAGVYNLLAFLEGELRDGATLDPSCGRIVAALEEA